jgi:hypothetical protein
MFISADLKYSTIEELCNLSTVKARVRLNSRLLPLTLCLVQCIRSKQYSPLLGKDEARASRYISIPPLCSVF